MLGGEENASFALAHALRDAATHDSDTMTHGFHSYTARIHPRIASSVIRDFAPRDGVVMDPFCGSGTVLVEAILAGHRAVGSDLNPLAVRLAHVKTERRDEESRRVFGELVDSICDASTERVQNRVSVVAKLPKPELRFYDPHVLKELAGLWELIHEVDDRDNLLALEMMFSSIVVKFSKQVADSSGELEEKRIRKGLVTEFFQRKGQELTERWEELYEAWDPEIPEPHIELADVRSLPEVLAPKYHADIVVTSPPYGGTYDYVDHHARRFAWFGIDSRRFFDQEIGARRNISAHHHGAERWDKELFDALHAIADVTRPGGLVVLLQGDGESRGEAIDARAQISKMAPKVGLSTVAVASAPRPDWRGPRRRFEHLMMLSKK